ncbi:MAG: ATP-binding cassette domain-containing protein [Gammaproteobacteria bacterium]|nr:ATP-binding cassette domain-containing protein [Gammaproteobacteria bacterium]
MHTGEPGRTMLSPDPVIEVRDLTLRFGRKVVHDRLNLTVRRGEILAIVGGSGSGKSTLLRMMAMLQPPSAGTVLLLGDEVTSRGLVQNLELRRRLGVLFQQGALFGGMSVLENIGVPLHEHSGLSARLIDEIGCVKLELVGLEANDGLLYPNQLSGGMRKRAALARAIALDPELLFLDEPTSGLDPLSAAAFDELILELKSALDPTIVMVTHDMDSLWQLADRVILLGETRVLAEGTMEEMADSRDPAVMPFFQNPRARAARAAVERSA